MVVASRDVGRLLHLLSNSNDGNRGADAFVWRQVGYSVADVLAKCLFGLLIYKIAREKSSVDSAEFNAAELEEAPSSR